MSGTRRFSTRLQRNARWWWTFWATVEVALVTLVDIPWLRLVDAAFAAWFGLWAGWHWRDWAQRRDMKRRNAFVIEGATRAEVDAFIEELTWFVEQRKTGER